MKFIWIILLSSIIILQSTNAAYGITQEEYEAKLLNHVANIEVLLNEARAEYASGNVEEAKKLAMTAYIDNYEYLEGPVAEQDEEFNYDLEVELREELQALMRNNAPVEDVNLKIDVILEKMDIVKVMVPEFGTIAVMILVVAITSVIIFGSKNKNSQFFIK